MAPPSSRTLWLRLALLLVVGGGLVLSPIPRQVFGKGGRGAPRWSMFSDVGTDVCIAAYSSAGDHTSLGHFPVLQPGRAVRSPQSARLRSGDTYQARTAEVCRTNRRVQEIGVHLYCPGRTPKQESRTDVCEMSG